MRNWLCHSACWWIVLLFAPLISLAQERATVASLVQQLRAEQTLNHPFYHDGLFPSERRQKGKWRDDDNIFFPALIDFTLANLPHGLSDSLRLTIDSVQNGIRQNYQDYSAKPPMYTYNFWIPKVNRHFPNSSWSKRSHYALPDDLDDTSLLITNLNDKQSALLAKSRMQNHINTDKNKAKGTLRKYRKLPAYSSWFGLNMPVDFDVCVMSNIMIFNGHFNLPFTAADSASVAVISHSLESKDYQKRPNLIAPHYQRTSVILYHYARMVANNNHPQINRLKPAVIDACKTQLDKAEGWDALLLHSALMRLAIPMSDYSLKIPEPGTLHFFIANAGSTLPLYFRRFTELLNLYKMPYRCRAFELALLLEHHLLLQENKNKFFNPTEFQEIRSK